MARILSASIIAVMLTAGFQLAPGNLIQPAQAAKSDTSASDEYLSDAQKYLDKGDVNAAIIQLKNALQKDPANVGARKLLGEIYLRVGNGPAAEKEFRAALRRGGNDKSLTALLASSYLLQGKFDKVLKELKDDVTDPDLRLEVLVARGRAYHGLQMHDEAREAFLRAEKLKGEDIRSKIGLARILIVQGKPKEAEDRVDAVLVVAPDSVDTLVLKAELRRFAGDLKIAVEYFDKVTKIREFHTTARLGRAAAFIDLNEDVAAQADIQAVLQRSPNHPLALYLSALRLAKLKDYAGAEDALQLAGARLDNHLPSVFLKGAIAYALEQLEQAANHLKRYVQLNPANIRARKLLGATLVRKNDPKGAIETLKPIVDSGKGDVQIFGLLGSAYMKTGKFAEGSEMYERAAKASPGESTIRMQLAVSRLALGASDKAVTDLQAAIDLKPDAYQAGILLALVHLRKKEFDEALKVAERLKASMRPNNPLPFNLIGAAQLGKKQFKEARITFETALKMKPDFHPARMNLAQLDLRDKNLSAAIRHYEKIVVENPKHVGAMMALANIAVRDKDHEKAIDWYKKASVASPKSVAPKLRLIKIYQFRQEIKKALAIAHELDSSVPNNPQVLETLGRLEIVSRDIETAVTTFRRLVTSSPRSPRAHHLLGGALVAANNLEMARDHFKKALSINPDFVETIRALVELDTRIGNYDAALKLADRVEQNKKDNAMGPMLAGDINMRAGRFDAAVKAYERAMSRENAGYLAVRRYNARRRAATNPVALTELKAWVDSNKEEVVRHVLATNYIKAKLYPQAIRESEIILTSTPDNPIILNNLAWLYDQKGDSRSLDYAERAYKRAPKSPAIMDTLGWILFKQGQLSRALDLLRRASIAAPKQGDIAYHFAVALRKQGDTRESRRTLRRILRAKVPFDKSREAEKMLKEMGG